jgi:uncharacterized protein (TIGR00304 family)
MGKEKGAGPSLYIVGSICLFAMAFVFMALAVQSGEADVGIFLIFPFVMGGGLLMGVGVLFVFLGILTLIVGLVKRFTVMALDEYFDEEVGGRPAKGRKRRPRTVGDQEVRPAKTFADVKGGGVVFIGPIPIVFGSNARVTKLMLYLAIVAVIALCMLFFALTLR